MDIDLTDEELSQFVLWLLLTAEFKTLTQRENQPIDPSGKECS
jgi:hypothetical protein